MSSLLRRRFDPSKCKTLLQLVSKRLTVLRNKQALTVKKARGDVAKLLEKNQDRDAKLQVDAVFGEEKILVRYNLLDKFCRLIIDALESIKSQKECPLDLREAVASVIFAAPKCAEVGELKLVSKQLKSKYGKEFYRAAKELRPDCGVNQQVIQNFSSLPVDYEGRLNMLKEIAVENSINWDHETAIANVPTGATDLINGPNHHVASAAELSQLNTPLIHDKQKARSMHVIELKGQGNAILQNAIGSLKMSAANPLGLPAHAAHQFAKNIGAMGSSMVSDRILQTPVLNPYALARMEGKMDYEEVSEYMKRAGSMELKQERGVTQLPESAQVHNVFLNASYSDDALQRSQGELVTRIRHDLTSAHRISEEEALLELQNAAELAYKSANHAAEAAKAAVDLVRMESLERSRSRMSGDEDYMKSRMDAKRSFNRHRLSCENESEIESSQHNEMVSNHVTRMNSPYPRDAGEDSLKYVVFEQSSNSQKYAWSSTQPREYKRDSESDAFPEVWSEPTLYTRKSSDKIIFDVENEESISKEIAAQPSFDSESMKEKEFDEKASSSSNEDNNRSEVHKIKHAQSDLPVPQFDDYSSDEDEYVQQNLLAPQFDDHVSEEANEEEEPFYLRGRATVAPEDYANASARAPYSKESMLMSTVSSSTDEEEEELSTNMENRDGSSVEPLGASNDKERAFIMGTGSALYDIDEGSQKAISDEDVESLPAQSSKSHQISTKFNGENSITTSARYKESSVKPMTPRKLQWATSIFEDWDLDPSYYKAGPPLGSVKFPAQNENKDASSSVNRKPNWSPGVSEDSEYMSERSFDSHKLSWHSEDLKSSKPSFDTEDSTKTMDATHFAQPPTPRSYAGVSKRSIRSTRSRQNEGARVASSGNEDVINP